VRPERDEVPHPAEVTLDPERWQRIQELFHRVADLPPAERRAALEAACAGDPGLISEVLALADEDDRADSVLDRGLAGVAEPLFDSAAGLPVPREFGPYRLLELAGEGGMGVVYLAERADLGTRVAVKILRDGWVSPSRRRRFASEQRTLARLDHPGIARLYDAGTLPDGTPWIVMEYVAGTARTEYCAARAGSIREVLLVFRAACEAVQHAHAHAIVHRDLKPSNILVTPEGRVKLLDFGIAKQLEAEEAGSARTRTGLAPMTPAYAAPEQLAGGVVGVHTDIYSLGVVLFELLAGAPPFDLADHTPAEAERMVREQEPPRPSVVAAGAKAGPGHERPARSASRSAWADLDVLSLTAMQKDPARRYATVESFVRDLDHFLRGEPLEARRDSAGYRLGKFVRRRWRSLTAAAASVAVLAGIGGYYTAQLAAARNRAVAEVERTRRIQGFMTRLFEGGDVAGPADTLRVLTLVGRGVREARSLAGEPAVQAELYQTLGGIYRGLGDLERADSLLAAALDLRRSSLGAGHPDVSRTMVEIGLLRVDQSRLEEADSLVRAALGRSRATRPPDAAAVARVTRALGIVLESRGEYDGAIAVLTEAARLDSAAGLPPAEAVATLTELANCHFYAGHYVVSDSLNRRVLALDERLHGPGHPNVASDLINLGAIAKELGRFDDAERRYRRALEIYRGWYGPQHFEVAATLTMMSRALIPRGRVREAGDMLREALAIREKVFGPDHPSVASTVNELGNLALAERRLDDAEAAFRRVSGIYERTYRGRHYLIGIARSNLGSVLLERGRYGEAERLYRDAIARYDETLPPDHLYTGIARIKLGRTLLRGGRAAEAIGESLAGYRIVSRQAEPSVGWLQNARQDLAAGYQSLGRGEEAAKFQAEWERTERESKRAPGS
jgi:serine/threonine-protein kinase